MITPSKTKSRFEQLSSGIYACHFCENNQQVCIDCLKPRSYKNKFECKKYGSAKFMCSIIRILHLKYFLVCNV